MPQCEVEKINIPDEPAELDDETRELQLETVVVVHLHLLEFVVIMEVTSLAFSLHSLDFGLCQPLFGLMPYQFVASKDIKLQHKKQFWISISDTTLTE